jgi:hypothetical protein
LSCRCPGGVLDPGVWQSPCDRKTRVVLQRSPPKEGSPGEGHSADHYNFGSARDTRLQRLGPISASDELGDRLGRRYLCKKTLECLMLAHHDADYALISGSGDSCRAGEQSRPHIIIFTPTTSPPCPSPASASRRSAKTQLSSLGRGDSRKFQLDLREASA